MIDFELLGGVNCLLYAAVISCDDLVRLFHLCRRRRSFAEGISCCKKR